MLAIVIDDSSAMRRIIRGILARLGFSVYEAAHGQEALDLLEEIPTTPDVALVDWNMPVMDGLEFIRRVRKMDGLRGMCLMMVTTESEHGQVVRALAAGAHEYVTKPFTPETIHEKLRYLGLDCRPAGD
ncbi:chemotaxis response regulator CheY [Planomonospora alba]|uniref:Chemotaxis response regulator CheY n=1 Tax=Planomonospora alba TaxID=161354 RepID=A0ABP6MZK2_9ACTN